MGILKIDHISTSVLCLSCGYNLRTLPVTACCPECGAPASQSLSSGWRTANPRLLRHRAFAAQLLASLNIAIPLLAVLALVLAKTIPGKRQVLEFPLLLCILLSPGFLLAAWWATLPPPRRRRNTRHRALLICSLAPGYILAALAAASLIDDPNGKSTFLLLLLAILLLPLLPVFFVLLGGHYARLCPPLGAFRLATIIECTFGAIAVIFASPLVVGVFCLLIKAVFPSLKFDRFIEFASIITAATLALLLFLAMPYLLFTVADRLNSRAKELDPQA